MNRRAAGAARRATEVGFRYRVKHARLLRVPEDKEEERDMTYRKRAVAIATTVVASLALVFGASAPASASPTSGTLWCPSFMVARVSFKATHSGYVTWGDAAGRAYWSKTTATHYAYAPRSGPVWYRIQPTTGYVYDVYATCV